MAENTNKVVTLGSLSKAIEKIKGDFATKVELEEAKTELEGSVGANIEYATDDEVLALFGEEATESV